MSASAKPTMPSDSNRDPSIRLPPVAPPAAPSTALPRSSMCSETNLPNSKAHLTLPLITTTVQVLTAWMQTKEVHEKYQPGGLGFLEAKQHFETLSG